MTRGERRAAAVRQLLRVHLDGQSAPRRSVEYALALLERKADALAEHVDGIDESFVGERGQHALAHFIDVVIRAAREFRRQRVRAEERRVDGHGITLAQLPRDTQHLALALQVEPVAGFDFDGRHAFGEHRFEPRRRLTEERCLVGGTRRTDRRHDAAAQLRDRFVAHARETLREFVGALAAVHEMRVAIDEPRRHPRAAQLFTRPGRILRGQLARRAEPRNAAVLDGDRGIVDRFVGVALRAELEMVPDGWLHWEFR